MEAEPHIFGSPGRDEMRKWTPIFESPGRTSAEDERDLSKSWPSGSTERNFRSLAVKTERNCGSKASDLYRS